MRTPREVIAEVLHRRYCTGSHGLPAQPQDYDQADQVLIALKAAGWGLWRKVTPEEEVEDRRITEECGL